jgi:hypothetical protein
VTQLNALSVKYDDGEIEPRKCLLKSETPISRKKHVEFLFCFLVKLHSSSHSNPFFALKSSRAR